MIHFMEKLGETKDAEELLAKASSEDVELLKKYYVLYKRNDINDNWRISGLFRKDDVFNEEKEEMVAAPFTSVYNGTSIFDSSRQFINVFNSTGDQNTEGGSWIGLMKIVYRVNGYDLNKLMQCCAQKAVIRNGNQEYIDCGTSIVGAHITDQLNMIGHELAPGYEYVYLLPLCSSHNHYANYNIIMTPNTVLYAIKLAGYKQII